MQISKKQIVVVIYNCDIQNADTFQSLVSCNNNLNSDNKITIWDNSKMAQIQADIELFRKKINCKVDYIHTPENISLAKIYNVVLSSCPENSFLILLDQDSKFSESFFLEFEEAATANPEINLFMPLIESNGYIVSPGTHKSYKGKYWSEKKYGLVESKDTNAISSGMIIRTSIFKKIGLFDETLKLYGIDTNFMIRYGRFYKQFFVMKCLFIHNLSDHNSEEVGAKIRRFRDLRKSWIRNAKLFPIHVQLLSVIYSAYKSVDYAIKFKNFNFIKRS